MEESHTNLEEARVRLERCLSTVGICDEDNQRLKQIILQLVCIGAELKRNFVASGGNLKDLYAGENT